MVTHPEQFASGGTYLENGTQAVQFAEGGYMKISVFEGEAWELEHFKPLSAAYELTLLEQPLTLANAAEHADADIISTFIYSKLPPEVLDKLEQVKLIATRSTGFDHIPLDICNERGIIVCNVPTYGP